MRDPNDIEAHREEVLRRWADSPRHSWFGMNARAREHKAARTMKGVILDEEGREVRLTMHRIGVREILGRLSPAITVQHPFGEANRATRPAAETKIAAAREAIEKAAALLLEHAEGVAMLAMVAKQYEPPQPIAISFESCGAAVIRNAPAERAYAQASLAAAAFAGRFEEFQQALDLPTKSSVAMRESVEKLVGPDGGPPPPLSRMPAWLAGSHHHGITAGNVYRQAWRSYLASSTAALRRPA